MLKLGTDIKSGAVFVALGLFFVIYALVELPIGTPNRMGPGYFPLALAVILIALGAGIIFAAHDRGVAAPPIPWRAVLMVVVSLAVFALTVRGIGLVISVALVVFISTFASRKTTLQQALFATAGITVFCVLVFHYALNLNIQLFGPWLRFG